MDRYVTLSLELHLFFARIMKEHSLFLEAGFTPADGDFARKRTSTNGVLSRCCAGPSA